MKARDDFRIVFMGTPAFAVPSLEILYESGYAISGVVSVPDKPQGRGLKRTPSPVVQYALSKGLTVFQPDSLKSYDFIENMRALNADLFVVVAFRMLPESVWSIPACGTINLHASLLPQYRGAAPINWAIIHGEKITGVTTFFIEKEIDTGKIIMQTPVNVDKDENAGQLHDKLMKTGACLLLETVDAIRQGNTKPKDQSLMSKPLDELKTAPRIFKPDCRIEWGENCQTIHQLIKGLSPYPGAFTFLVSPTGDETMVKIYDSKPQPSLHDHFSKQVLFDENTKRLLIGTMGGFLEILELQLPGKKRMAVQEFLKGFQFKGTWRVN